MARFLALSLVVLLATVHFSSALKCYTCTFCQEPYVPSEADVKTSTILGDCAMCTKTKVGPVVDRSCLPDSAIAGKTESCSGTDPATCYCTTDNCNGASMSVMSALTLAVSVIISKLF